MRRYRGRIASRLLQVHEAGGGGAGRVGRLRPLVGGGVDRHGYRHGEAPLLQRLPALKIIVSTARQLKM